MAKKKEQSEENSSNEDTPSESSYSLNDLPGVGEATVKKLKDAGIFSIRILAMYPLNKLMDEAGIGEKTAEKIIRQLKISKKWDSNRQTKYGKRERN